METLERLAGALGLRLELDATETDSGVDPTLVAAALRHTPVQRLRRMAQAMRSIERMRAARGERAPLRPGTDTQEASPA